MIRYVVTIAAGLALSACEANFVDLRPDGDERDRISTDTAMDTVEPMETGTPDASDADVGPSPSDTTMDAETGGDDVEDDTSEPDGSDATGRVVARGQFQPRDYQGEGTVELYEAADGSWEVRLGDDFQVDDTPGPVVILTRRQTMGSQIKPGEGDKELGVLRSNSGADQYDVPGGPGSRRVVFIYCKPFGAEMLRAILEAP